MILALKILLLISDFAGAAKLKVFCDVEAKTISSGFTLAASLNVNERAQTVSTGAVITLKDFSVPNKVKITAPIVVESRGFYRRIRALGGYTHTVLIPLADNSRILSMDLKLDIDENYQSVIELDETKKYYSNCKSLQ